MSSELFANEPDMEKLQLVYSKLSEDPEAAIEELQRLADAGSTMSMIYIANLFQHGRGVPVDLKEYEVWLRRAEASGSVFAAYKLARLYMASHEFVAAENSLVWSASAGFLPSIARLGSIYSNGFGVAINKLEARRLLEAAYKQGHLAGMRNLAHLLLRGDFGFIAQIRGAILYFVLPLRMVKISYRKRHENSDALRLLDEQLH